MSIEPEHPNAGLYDEPAASPGIDLVAKFVEMGARYVSTGTDMSFPMAECTRKVKFVKNIAI